MPRRELQVYVDRHQAALRVPERAVELLGNQRAPHHVPPFVDRLEQAQRDLHRQANAAHSFYERDS